MTLDPSPPPLLGFHAVNTAQSVRGGNLDFLFQRFFELLLQRQLHSVRMFEPQRWNTLTPYRMNEDWDHLVDRSRCLGLRICVGGVDNISALA